MQINALLRDETLWLTQKALAELFETDRSVITEHIGNIFSEGELQEMATCAHFAQVQVEGNREVSRDIVFYNLDMIIAVGYRVNSKKATVKEYLLDIKELEKLETKLAMGENKNSMPLPWAI